MPRRIKAVSGSIELMMCHGPLQKCRKQAMVEMMKRIHIKRAYESASKGDGRRFLVDGLWPRGIRKETLKIDGWLKDVAPSAKLRKWFNHDTIKWAQFQARYRAELDAQPTHWEPLLDAAKEGDITLLFSAHDEAHNNAVVLKSFLEEKLKR